MTRRKQANRKKKKKPKRESTPQRRGVLPKMSEALIAVARPMLDAESETDPTFEVRRKYLLLTMLVWNAVLLEEDRTQQVLSKAAQKLALETGSPEEVFTQLFALLAERKMALFPDDRRFIVDVKLNDLEDGRYRVVASSTPFD